MTAIDVHHHWMPRALFEDLGGLVRRGENIRREGEVWKLERSDMGIEGQNAFHTRFFELDAQAGDLDENGFSMAVLSLPAIQEYVIADMAAREPGEALRLCRMVNDATAEAVARDPRHFVGLAHVPPLIGGAVEELRRAVRDLDLRGLSLVTNIHGVYPDDPALEPVLRVCAELEAPLFLHPPVILNLPALAPYDLTRSLGKIFDLSIAAARILYGGLTVRYPGLKIILPKLGGDLLVLLGRLSSKTYLAPHLSLDRALEGLYFDTSTPFWQGPELSCAVSLLGADRLVLGSDYPVRFEEDGCLMLQDTRRLIADLCLSADQEEKIMAGNARRLFRIPEAD